MVFEIRRNKCTQNITYVGRTATVVTTKYKKCTYTLSLNFIFATVTVEAIMEHHSEIMVQINE